MDSKRRRQIGVCAVEAAGNPAPAGAGAALWHGLNAMATNAKAEMPALVLRAGPYTPDERRAFL